ncbi:hypothetical protein NDU88_002258 [Pleurodeles waltl]|uniref:Secreted protein n=1 Tax=Pleurodeles waltl TaxID=8319 RepID=A0AAV7W3J3_PLEWA|nr:hypothetical protein NDU88_002258 [Pleurodeles waltl]
MSPVPSAYAFMLCSTGLCVGRCTPTNARCGLHLIWPSPTPTPPLVSSDSPRPFLAARWFPLSRAPPASSQGAPTPAAVSRLPTLARVVLLSPWAAPIRGGPAAPPCEPAVGCNAESAAAELSGFWRRSGSPLVAPINTRDSAFLPPLLSTTEGCH